MGRTRIKIFSHRKGGRDKAHKLREVTSRNRMERKDMSITSNLEEGTVRHFDNGDITPMQSKKSNGRLTLHFLRAFV